MLFSIFNTPYLNNIYMLYCNFMILVMKQERQLDGINQVAVLMHNDFLYMSQEILGLAFQVSK